ncbi:class I SAM-dependent methyltransferase [Chloroflexota bacterium]
MLKEVFDKIAPGWYNFRHWSIFSSELESLAERWQAEHWQKGSLLNIGCAHGPDFLPFRKDFTLYGVDFSGEMLNLAGKYAHKFEFTVNLFQADVRKLPFTDESFDKAISIATYHHIEGKNEQLTALTELKRVLKPGGEAFITVWNHWQPRFWSSGSETTVPWRIKEETLYRYYHLFSYPELEKLVKQAGFRILKSSPESSHRFPLKYFSRNICLLVKKPD